MVGERRIEEVLSYTYPVEVRRGQSTSCPAALLGMKDDHEGFRELPLIKHHLASASASVRKSYYCNSPVS